jgi:hypothetical protein
MTEKLPTPAQLAESPELAALHTLQVALQIAERALLSTHPQLELIDPFAHPPLAIDACLADAILTHLAGLEAAIGRYRLLLRHPEYRQMGLELGF